MTELICIVCPKGCHLTVNEADGYAVTGNQCVRGAEYGKVERQNPTRMVCSTVPMVGSTHRRCPVKTDRPIPKGLMAEAVAALDGITLTAPVALGQLVAENLCGTGVNFITTRDFSLL